MTTTALLSQVRARLAAATPGPKEVIRFDNNSGEIDYQVAGGKPYIILCQFGDFDNPKAKADAHLLAHAPTDLAKLLAIVEVMQAALEAIRDRASGRNHLLAYEALRAADKIAGER